MHAPEMGASPAVVVRELLEAQRAWAAAREIELVDGLHVRVLEQQLYDARGPEAPPPPAAGLAEDGKPAAACSLLSRSVLAWNLLAPLAAAVPLGAFASTGGTACARGRLLPRDRSAGSALDAALESPSTRPVALAVRYREPYETADARPPAEHAARATASGLSMCGALLSDLYRNPRRFRSFPAAALAADATAWTETHGPRGFRLVYVWHEVDHAAARAHRREIDRFRMRVGGEIDFEARSLRDVVGGLEDVADVVHAAWLRDRYLGPRTDPAEPARE